VVGQLAGVVIAADQQVMLTGGSILGGGIAVVVGVHQPPGRRPGDRALHTPASVLPAAVSGRTTPVGRRVVNGTHRSIYRQAD
jgi:hypothetical protein